MAFYDYKIELPAHSDVDIALEFLLPDPGSAAHHVIDLPPGFSDYQCVDSCSKTLGKAGNLKIERTVIFSKAVNLDINNPDVNIRYLINGNLILNHTNPKSIDPSPLIKVNITFV